MSRNFSALAKGALVMTSAPGVSEGQVAMELVEVDPSGNCTVRLAGRCYVRRASACVAINDKARAMLGRAAVA